MSAASERSFGAVVRDIGGNIDRIVRAELRMAIAEVQVGVRAAGGAALVLVVVAEASVNVGLIRVELLKGIQPLVAAGGDA